MHAYVRVACVCVRACASFPFHASWGRGGGFGGQYAADATHGHWQSCSLGIIADWQIYQCGYHCPPAIIPVSWRCGYHCPVAIYGCGYHCPVAIYGCGYHCPVAIIRVWVSLPSANLHLYPHPQAIMRRTRPSWYLAARLQFHPVTTGDPNRIAVLSD
jgi:hypothetical protein